MEAVLPWLDSKEVIVQQVARMKTMLAGVASIMDPAASPENKLDALRAVQVGKPEHTIRFPDDLWKEVQEALAEQGVRKQIEVIHSGLTSQIAPLCEKVLSQVQPLLAVKAYGQDVDDAAGYFNGLQLLHVLDLEAVNTLVPQARDILDCVLEEQLMFLQVAFDVQKATTALALHLVKNSKSREAARINEKVASLLSQVRTSSALLRQHGTFLSQREITDVFAPAETTNHIVRTLDGLVKHLDFMVDALAVAELLISTAQSQYVMDAEQLAEVVMGWGDGELAGRCSDQL